MYIFPYLACDFLEFHMEYYCICQYILLDKGRLKNELKILCLKHLKINEDNGTVENEVLYFL